MKLLDLIKEARFVFVCGNGGSAANAEHFTNDLFSKGIKAICLNSNVSIMTMIANDYDYQEVFQRQLEVYANPKEDLLITISCSGTSLNVVNAIDWAEMNGMKHFEFETFRYDKDYGKLEDRHLVLIHEIKDEL